MAEAWAQNRQVTGKIIESSGQAIPGASVLVKGTTSGANTNTNGEFTVTLNSTDAVLLITAVGYKTQEIVVGNQTRIDVTLQEEAASLNEVVVTGYTTDSRRETTGAVSTVKTKDLTVTPSGNVEQQLQGRVAGVTVITNGQPGTTSQVRVRGFGAFGGNEPLYIVDGVPTSSTEFLNPDDIESTTVLKDAASASIYGARAASGVIVYTTKKGQRQARKLTVTYDGLFGLTDPGKGQQMMNPTDFANWTWNAYRNNGWKVGDDEWTHPQFGNGASPVIPDYLMVGKNYGVVGNLDMNAERAKYNVNFDAGDIYQVVATNRQGTDWYKAITRTAPLMRHSLGFSGGTESSRYYVGLGIQTQAGILKYNDFKRYSIRANTEFDVLKNLRIGQNFQATYRQVLGQSGGNGGAGVSADENDILSAFRMPSIIPIYDVFGGYAGTAAKGFNNPRNPVASRDGQKDNRGFGASAFGNAYLEFDPIQNLTLRSSIGGSYTGYSNWGYNRRQYENSENNSAFSYNETYGFNFAWTFTNTANFKKDFGLHNVDVLVGQEALNTGAGRENRTSGQSPFSIDKNYVTITNVSSRVANSDLYRGATFYSLFGRLKYSFNEGKYVVTGLVRRDGSSKFAAANRFGVFPAFSAAWRISEEPFLKNVGFLQDLKIRGGWGIMGNSNNVNPTNQYSLYATTLGQSAYDLNGTNSSTLEGYYRSQIGNPFAKWESSVTSNIGFDATLFDGKLDVILDLWRKNTKDLLFQVPVTAEVGTSAHSWLSLVLVLSYCQSGSALLAEKGAQLVDQHCSSCHLSVRPELLDRQTWLEQVLPAMAPKLGIGTTANGEYYPETNAALPFEEWLILVDYFRQFAPDTLLPAQRVPVSSDHSLFTIKPAPADSAAAMTLMVHLEKDRVYSAQATNAMLVQWDQHLNRVDSVRFPTPVVQLHVRSDSELFATSIGTMRAQDQWAGSLIHRKGSNQTILARQMPRPIHTGLGDFNRDGRTDWLIAGFGHTQGGLYLTSQRADGTYETRLLTAQPGATQIEVGDFNADGWPDAIVLFAHANEGLWLFQNDRKGGFKSTPLLRFLPLAGSSSFQLVDLNKDGKLDLIYTSGDNSDYSRILKPYHGLYIYLNEGNFKFRKHWFYPINGATKVLAEDFDLDGDVDLATIAFFADFQHHPQENFLYFKQTQPLHFEPYSLPITTYGRWICMDAKDWDGDGDTDVVLGNFSKGFRNLPHVQPHWSTKIPFIILENKTRNKLEKRSSLLP